MVKYDASFNEAGRSWNQRDTHFSTEKAFLIKKNPLSDTGETYNRLFKSSELSNRETFYLCQAMPFFFSGCFSLYLLSQEHAAENRQKKPQPWNKPA